MTDEDAFLRAVARAPPVAPAELAPRSGAIGRYDVLGELGRGGMGVVLRARDRVLGREVALKVLPAGGVGDARARARLVREARAAAAVTDPGIATVFDVGDADGHLHIAMELVPGQTLRRLLEAAPRGLPLDEVVAVGGGIARALAAAHRAGIVHRDLKPENVMRTPEGAIKILDFGLARAGAAPGALGSAAGPPRRGVESSESRAGGTRAYAAPEQLAGGVVGERADVWALGVVLGELATGVRPASIGARRPPRELCALLERCLAPRPDDRPSAAEVADVLSRRAAGRRRAQRMGIGGAALALAALGLALGLALSGRGGSDAPLEREGAARARPRIARLACVHLDGEIAGEPAAWLGAAAASVACKRARAWAGPSSLEVLVPGALLDLAPRPSDDVTGDPFEGAPARARAERAARARADRWLEGRIDATRAPIELELVVRDAEGATVASAGASGPSVVAAVAVAVDELVAREVLPRVDGPDPWSARWLDEPDAQARVVRAEAWAFALTGADPTALAALVERSAAVLGADAPLFARHAALTRGAPPPRLAAPGVQASSAPAFGRSAFVHVALSEGADAAALADRALRFREAEADPRGRDLLLGLEARLRSRTTDAVAARALALAAVGADPAFGPWDTLAMTSYGQPGFSAVGRAYAAWVPEASDALNIAAQDRGASDAERAELLRRACVLSGDHPLYAGNLGTAAILGGRREEARSIAARLAAGTPAQRLAAARLGAEVLLSELRPGAALPLLLGAIEQAETIGTTNGGDVVLLGLAMDVAHLLGRSEETALRLAHRLVLADPPRLSEGGFATTQAATICAAAGPSASRRCFDRLRALSARPGAAAPDVAAYVEGAERASLGDWAGAASHLRRIREVTFGQHRLVAEALDRAGEPDLAERVDAPLLARGIMGGVTSAHARAATRALRRGDVEAARALARRVVEAWAATDAPLPAVRAMRALLARTGGA